MKFTARGKLILFSTFFALYLSGLAKWILAEFFQTNHGYGPEATPAETLSLHLHGMIGLGFLMVFGWVASHHARAGWKAKRKVKSGGFFIIALSLLILTVPILYYSSSELFKNYTAVFHTYLGLALLLPLATHLRTK